MCIAGIALEQSRPTTQGSLEKYGTVWSRENNRRTKEKAVKTAQETFGAMPVVDVALVRGLLQVALEHDSMDVLQAFARDYGGDTLLAIMRLWKTRYTLTTHKKILRHIE